MRLCIALVIALASSLPVYAQTSIRSPNVSANGLFLFRNSNFAGEDQGTVRNGLDIREAEIAFYSDVDPYSRLVLILGIHPEYENDSTTGEVTEHWHIAPEEAYVESGIVPSTLLKLGKFNASVGKHNRLHVHAFPFVDAPLANQAFLGDEGFRDVGLSAAVMLPTNWFSEFTVQYLRGEGENEAFASPTPNDAVGVGHWKNLFDLSDITTLEAGLSYASGNNGLGGATTVTGADITLKWRPSTAAKYRSLTFAAEYLARELEQLGVASEKGAGWNTWARYQFAERWSVGGRYDHLKVENADSTVNPNALTNGSVDRYTASVNFNASEFSTFRLEYAHGIGQPGPKGDNVEQAVYLQAGFTIGAHPAHEY